jgi:hypothetical protein
MSKIQVKWCGGPETPTNEHIREEVQRYSKLVEKNPRSGGPLTPMERGILFAYLRDSLAQEASETEPPENT